MSESARVDTVAAAAAAATARLRKKLQCSFRRDFRSVGPRGGGAGRLR